MGRISTREELKLLPQSDQIHGWNLHRLAEEYRSALQALQSCEDDNQKLETASQALEAANGELRGKMGALLNAACSSSDKRHCSVPEHVAARELLERGK